MLYWCCVASRRTKSGVRANNNTRRAGGATTIESNRIESVSVHGYRYVDRIAVYGTHARTIPYFELLYYSTYLDKDT
jgi:hypothetical protein